MGSEEGGVAFRDRRLFVLFCLGLGVSASSPESLHESLAGSGTFGALSFTAPSRPSPSNSCSSSSSLMVSNTPSDETSTQNNFFVGSYLSRLMQQTKKLTQTHSTCAKLPDILGTFLLAPVDNRLDAGPGLCCHRLVFFPLSLSPTMSLSFSLPSCGFSWLDCLYVFCTRHRKRERERDIYIYI